MAGTISRAPSIARDPDCYVVSGSSLKQQRFPTERCSSYWGAKVFLHVHNNQSGLVVLDFGDCHNLLNQYGTPYQYCKVSSRFLDRSERKWKDP